jgi:intein/homing endonuclease
VSNCDIVVTQKLHGCVDKNTLIETDIGIKTIGEIVDNRLNVKVKSMNIQTNEIIFSKIDDFYLLKDDGEWYEIELEDGRTIIITGNNPVWLPDLGCYRRVDELSGNENLLVT